MIDPRVPDRIQEPYRSILRAATEAWAADLGERLVSVVLFGSTARGDASSDSDIDVLVVAEGFPRALRERRAPLLEAWERVRVARDLPWVEWSLVTKSVEEARCHTPLYLDLVEDGVAIIDRGGFMAGVLDGMRRRMQELGSRRVFLEDGSWYWDLKPDYRPAEVVEL